MKYIVIIIFIFVLINCNKSISPKKTDPTLETSLNKSNEANYEKEEEINIENKDDDKIMENVAKEAKEYLIDYFLDQQYVLVDYPLDVNYRKIYFAVHYIEKEKNICDTIIGFEMENQSFKKYLLIKDFRFLNGDDSILIDFSHGYSGIYGFNISYSHPTVEGFTPGLNIDTYFDNGDRIADTFTIMWNEDKKEFERVKWF